MSQSAQEAKGKLQQALGHLTDDKALEHDGKKNEQAGKLKELAKDAEHKVEELIDAAKTKLDRK